MKGAIVIAMREMVHKKFGKAKWEEALRAAGVDQEPLLFPSMDVDEQVCLKMIDALCGVLGLPLDQVARAFGDYWVNVYSQKIYGSFYMGVNTARDFLLKMDAVHVAMTRNMPDASPPRFEYEWRDEKTLIITYRSKRKLIDLAVGLIEGVGRFYKEDLQVAKLGPDRIEIIFP